MSVVCPPNTTVDENSVISSWKLHSHVDVAVTVSPTHGGCPGCVKHPFHAGQTVCFCGFSFAALFPKSCDAQCELLLSNTLRKHVCECPRCIAHCSLPRFHDGGTACGIPWWWTRPVHEEVSEMVCEFPRLID